MRSYFRACWILLSVNFLRRVTARDCRILIFRVVATGQPGRRQRRARKEAKRMLEWLLEIEVSEHGTVTEELELIAL
jgi:hypothetical protein